MPLEAPLAPVADRVADLNARYRHHGATAVLGHALTDPQVGRIALVSSFGAESVVLLHLISVLAPKTPVLFIDTELLFPETLAYQAELAARLNLSNILTIRAAPATLRLHDPDATLHQFNTDACCAIRKTEPLERALQGYDAWITGRKRFQGDTRATIDFFEAEGDTRIKVNPLAHWGREDLLEYMVNNRLPRHPLVAKGYPSIGCAPCTSPVAAGEDPRAGRWRGSTKQECGIHFIDGKAVRGPQIKEQPMRIIVTDQGFQPEDFTGPIVALDALATTADARAVDLANTDEPAALASHLANLALIRIAFPAFNDGRGFTLARRLRQMGYSGRLRAEGHIVADQYAMARRSGFDEVEIGADLAARQPAAQWAFRADWRAHDYQSRLRA